jgi:carbonic anhydrase
MSVTDDLLANNARYAESFSGPLPMPPGKHVAVVACMDARLDVYRILGLNEGEAHVIRNAGGVVTDDEIRSLAISQRLLGTQEIILIHHTDCGMLTFTDDQFKKSIQDETGIKPSWGAEAFPDLDEDVRQSIARIQRAQRDYSQLFCPAEPAECAMTTRDGEGLLRWSAIQRLVLTRASRSTPWSMPRPSSIHTRSSVARLPVADSA